jgi:hypothetical protein
MVAGRCANLGGMSQVRVELGVPVPIPAGAHAGLHLLLDVDDDAMVAGDPLLLIVCRDPSKPEASTELRRRIWPEEVGPLLADWGLSWR